MLSVQASEAEIMIEWLLRVHQQSTARPANSGTRTRRGLCTVAAHMEKKARKYEVDAEIVGQMLIDRDNWESHDLAG